MLNRAVADHKNSHPPVITLRLSLYPDRILGERIKKWRAEQGLFRRDLAKRLHADEMTIVNWEKGRVRPTKRNLEKLRALFGFEPPTR